MLPIGGLKEKLLAAIRNDVKTVLIPYENKKDLDEIQNDISSRIKVKTVKFVNEIFSHVLENDLNPILGVSSEIPTAIKGDILSSNPSSH